MSRDGRRSDRVRLWILVTGVSGFHAAQDMHRAAAMCWANRVVRPDSVRTARACFAAPLERRRRLLPAIGCLVMTVAPGGTSEFDSLFKPQLPLLVATATTGESCFPPAAAPHVAANAFAPANVVDNAEPQRGRRPTNTLSARTAGRFSSIHSVEESEPALFSPPDVHPSVPPRRGRTAFARESPRPVGACPDARENPPAGPGR